MKKYKVLSTEWPYRDALIRLVRSLRQTAPSYLVKSSLSCFLWMAWVSVFKEGKECVFTSIWLDSQKKQTTHDAHRHQSTVIRWPPERFDFCWGTWLHVYPHVPARSISLRLRSRSFGDSANRSLNSELLWNEMSLCAQFKSHNACKHIEINQIK